MMKAQQWQQSFSDALFNGLSEDVANTLNTIDPQERELRFAIYQNNVFYSLTEALGDLYPAIKTVVGDDFFKGTAAAFIRKHPPSQAAMVYFGEAFPEFLRGFEHTQSLPYLVDIAQLELGRHRAYHAADVQALSPADFADIDPTVFEASTLKLHPSVQRLSSPYPIFSIWQSSQEEDGGDETIDLNEPQCTFTVRHDYELQTFHIDLGTYRFYDALSEGLAVAEAVNYALEGGEYDIAAAIQLGISHGFFAKKSTNPNYS